jgi:hypothetical protein
MPTPSIFLSLGILAVVLAVIFVAVSLAGNP